MPDDPTLETPDLEAIPNPDGLLEVIEELRAAQRESIDVTQLLDDPAAEQVLGALLGDGWASRLFDARERAGVDALLKLEPRGEHDG